MIKVKNFWKCFKANGFLFFSGVPCSMLGRLLEIATADTTVRYVSATRENVALGTASGAYLAGKRSAVLMQNSGFGNVVNALTSFNLIYEIPVLLIITWRGYKGKDAPEHIIMGKKTLAFLKELRLPYRVLSDDYKTDIGWAVRTMEKRSIPVAIVLKEGQLK